MSSLKSDAAQSKRRKKPDKFFENQEVQAIGGKDVSLFLFRALGKILYCKSKEASYIFKNLLDISLTTEIKYHILRNVTCLVLLEERTRARSGTVWQGLRQSRKIYLEYFWNVSELKHKN